MSERVELLDHGYLSLVEVCGSDERIIEAARMSTGKGFLGWGPMPCTDCTMGYVSLELPRGFFGDSMPKVVEAKCCKCNGTQNVPGDEKLLRYLWNHKHTTPFETPGATFEVCCPVVVVWQWVRHRTMTYNILSGRYAEMPEEDYVPTVERLLLSDSNTNKQAGRASGSVSLSAQNAELFCSGLVSLYDTIQQFYRTSLANGVPKELARLPLGFSRYTRMRVTANLLNWTNFLRLRMAPNAQYEIRVYAQALCGILQKHFPRTMGLFMEGK